MSNIKIGTFTSAAGAEETVNLGFKPNYLVIMNQGADVGDVVRIDWFGAEMGDEKEFHSTVIQDTGASALKSQEYLGTFANILSSTGSVPVLSGDSLTFTGAEGFTIKAAYLTTADVIWYMAIGSD